MKGIAYKKDLIIIFVNFILLFISFGFLILGICIYRDSIPFFLILSSILSLIFYSGISIFSFIRLKKLKDALDDLNEANMHNQTLQSLYDNIRTFKHDFFNIMQSIEGYIKSGDTSALKKYYNEIKLECDDVNNLSVLNPQIIDEPAIYNLISSKYYKAKQLGISLDMHFLVKFSTLNVKMYSLSRILGILLDNALEAATSSFEKKVVFEIVPVPSFNPSKKIVNIIIENSYSNKNIDLSKICEKGFTSKPSDSRFSWTWFMESLSNFRKM